MKHFCISLIIILNTSIVFSQVNPNKPHYYQDQLDYLPHFKSFQLSSGQESFEPGLEFDKVLENILNSCSNVEYKLISHFGMASRMSGISPIGVSKESYFVMDLDETGKVSRLDVYNSTNSLELKECLMNALSKSKINPGLKDLQPVKCYFVYKFLLVQ